uniref:UDP glucuronosyltransferase 5 family, polypeptide D1 n=1 Tax=Sparus aurata TaxID=8175 RepID=A0A671U453_SPAAU
MRGATLWWLVFANGGNILVWYTEGSHWINMKPVLETLVDRGHQVTVLVPSASMFMNKSEPSRFSYEPFNVSVSKEDMRFSHFDVYLEIYIKFTSMIRNNIQNNLKFLDGVLKSETTMKKLKERKYDLLLSDPIYPGSDLTADILGLPLVFSLRFSIAHNWERLCGQLPAPHSFVPGPMSKLTDKMDFLERVWNFLYFALQDAVYDYVFWAELDKYYSEGKGEYPRNKKHCVTTHFLWTTYSSMII